MEKDIFECEQCGYCCHGETTVSLNEQDLERMSSHLALPIPELTEKFLRVTGKVVQMQIVDGHCVFYDNGCSVHPGRPWRCRQWPMHPSILGDEANFFAIASSCPGINKELGYEKFCQILTEVVAKQKYSSEPG